MAPMWTSGYRPNHSRGRLWLVALLFAIAVGMPATHCISDRVQHPSADQHHQTLNAAPGSSTLSYTAITTHPHAGSALHAAWCSVFDAPTVSARTNNPLRALFVVAALLGAVAIAMLWPTLGSRGPPRHHHSANPRFGRTLLTDLCVIRC